MKTFLTLFAAFVLIAGVALAAAVDGKWAGESKFKTRDGEERTITFTMELKSDGAKLSGTVIQQAMGGGEPRPVDIQEGKLEGNKFSFITVVETPNGERKTKWEGTVDGDAITGTRAREGAPDARVTPFTAKRQ